MARLAVAWLLHQPQVTSVLTGIRRPEQAAANAEAASLALDAQTLAALAEATEPVKRALGENPDLWQSGPSSRYR
jgi:aryl-alcohol dehydrogenase-like predicted oxidoreductase